MTTRRPWPQRTGRVERRGRLLFAFQAVASLALLAVVASRTDLARVTTVLGEVRYPALLAALAALVVQSCLCAYRWALVMRASGARVRLAGALGAFYVSLLLNQCFLPNLGADAYRIYWLHREGIPLAVAVRGVLIDRVSGLAALVAMLVATFPFLAPHLSAVARASVLLAVVASVLGTSAFLSLDLLPRRITRPLRQLAAVSLSARAVLLHGGSGIAIGVLALAAHCLSAVALLALAVGLSVQVTLTDCLLVVPAVTLLATLPISLGGWGVREGLLVVALSGFGVASAQGLALSITLGALVLVNGLFGLVPLLFDRNRFRGARVPAILVDDAKAT